MQFLGCLLKKHLPVQSQKAIEILEKCVKYVIFCCHFPDHLGTNASDFKVQARKYLERSKLFRKKIQNYKKMAFIQEL